MENEIILTTLEKISNALQKMNLRINDLEENINGFNKSQTQAISDIRNDLVDLKSILESQ
ncbi:hypothetical protein [Paenibacillus sp. FSL H7-0331]|uniref:hypothetical protein n=1 Tax=Paenibacillus sp. FSL H7-0331 TaxID=1920421 RepID=UPI00096DF5A9|nr:hypothetical protein [Paenibacillus sp. FSL H7-0331]OME97905.1 hypothetical protein BK127_40005 [Paenibacillus sp. FSL H7-0331]